jgi:hypothetical protein
VIKDTITKEDRKSNKAFESNMLFTKKKKSNLSQPAGIQVKHNESMKRIVNHQKDVTKEDKINETKLNNDISTVF